MNTNQINSFLSGKPYFSLKIKGKPDREIYILVGKDKPHEFILEAYDLSKREPVKIGFSSLYKTNGKEIDPIRFLELPEEAINHLRWQSHTYINSEEEIFELYGFRENYKGRGIGSTLFNRMMQEMNNRGGLRVVSFKPEGLERLYPKFVLAGYQPAQIAKPEFIPRNLADTVNWLYKFH